MHDRMPLLTEHEPPPRTRRGWWYGLVVLVLAAGAAYVLAPRLWTPSGDVDRTAAGDAPPPASTAPSEPENEPAGEPRPGGAATEPGSRPDPTPSATLPPPAPPAIVLRVTSDVDGAEVFVDRRYAGTTPFESYDVEPGSRRINVSAPGYEGHAEDVEITGELTTIAVRFREVRLDQRIPVIHKHRLGDCEGHLVAGTGGIVYQTADDDAFEVALDALDEFAVDYLEHNLRLKVRGGRTYNFTDRQENADALFAFHREVERARERLAQGDRPASQ